MIQPSYWTYNNIGLNGNEMSGRLFISLLWYVIESNNIKKEEMVENKFDNRRSLRFCRLKPKYYLVWIVFIQKASVTHYFWVLKDINNNKYYGRAKF